MIIISGGNRSQTIVDKSSQKSVVNYIIISEQPILTFKKHVIKCNTELLTAIFCKAIDLLSNK